MNVNIPNFTVKCPSGTCKLPEEKTWHSFFYISKVIKSYIKVLHLFEIEYHQVQIEDNIMLDSA